MNQSLLLAICAMADSGITKKKLGWERMQIHTHNTYLPISTYTCIYCVYIYTIIYNIYNKYHI